MPQGPDESSYTPQHLNPVLVSGDTNTGERKEVTVLVADLAGSLAISDSLDPEDTHEMMDGFFAIALDAVHREGGTLNQFRGDGFMALFGAPRARGDDAGRALRAALRIRQDAKEYADSVKEKFGLPFVLRMGVNTGLVWVGAIGADLRKDYTAEGPTVGIAARLEGEAEPGQILVGHETARRCEDHFDLEYIGPRTIRGLSGTTIVFELLGERDERTRLDVERRKGLTPFISRTAELEQLAARATPSDGVRFVEIRGEAGIGKSRLLIEFGANLPDSVAKVTLQCQEADSRRAYAPWLEALRREATPGGEVAVVDPLEPKQTKGLDDVEGDVRGLLERAARPGGAVVVVDDAQWLDPSSRRVIQALAESPPAGAISFVATLSHDGNRDWGAPVGVEKMELSPLADDDRRDLGRAILGSSPQAEALVEIAALRGGGNPLFIEELSRSLRDGTESLRRAAWLEVSLLNAVESVPDSLHGVVAARVDGLPELAKQCLESAAVIGREFDTSLLADAMGTHDSLTSVLHELCDLGLLRETPGGFGFSHGIVREVACGQLVRNRRAALHARVARALEARNVELDPDGASRIGAHYDAAGDSGRAAPLLEGSGRHYAKIGSPAEASSHLMRALELLRSQTPRHLAREAAIALVLASCL
ncbi:MAG: adenylate/guanylate cyclase domain-containing protein, partial [Myxococcota bacterium]